MDTVDLRSDVPPEANAIEILVTVIPSNGTIEITTSLDEDEPIVMWNGAKTILGAPELRQLFVKKIHPTIHYGILVIQWFK